MRWSWVVALGFTSMTTDISTEMVASVVPLYLLTRLDYSFARFGALDATLQLSVVLLGLIGAVLADRFRRHRELAGLGYVGSAAAKFGLALSAGSLPTMLFVDKVAKGVRTAPRDALLAGCSGPAHRGRVFGVHRLLDTAGALIGPVLAFGLLTFRPGRYDVVWVASSAFGIISVLIFALFVQAPVRNDRVLSAEKPPVRLSMPRPRVARSWAVGLLNPALRRIWAVAFLAGMAAIGDSFVLLVLRQRFDLAASTFPLLLSGASIAYLVLAVPIGLLADRRDPSAVMVGGVALLPIMYLVLLGNLGRVTTLVIVLVLMGTSTAALDGVLAVVTTRSVAVHRRAASLAVVAVGLAAGRWVGTASFGIIWSGRGRASALVWAVCLSVASGLSAWALLFPPSRRSRDH